MPPPEGKAKGDSLLRSGTGESTASKNESGKKAKDFDHLPVAEQVPGKKGYVMLSGKHSGFPEIDVRGIAPGTLVEIPDPDGAGKGIQFRVP